MWAELVKALIHNRQAAFTHGLRKQRVGPLAIHENLMVAAGEIENEVLSKFQSRVHSHLQGVKNRKNPSEDIELRNFNTIRKMLALCNVRNRLQIDSVAGIYTMSCQNVNLFISIHSSQKCHLFER